MQPFGIGLHFAVRGLLGSGARAVAVGAGASLWMAGLTLTMITLIERGAAGTAGLVGVVGLVATYAAYRVAAIGEAALRRALEPAGFEVVATFPEGRADVTLARAPEPRPPRTPA